jgi:hypothetical protein
LGVGSESVRIRLDAPLGFGDGEAVNEHFQREYFQR